MPEVPKVSASRGRWLVFLVALAAVGAAGDSLPSSSSQEARVPDPAALVATIEKLGDQAVPDRRVQAGYFLPFRGKLKEVDQALGQLAGLGKPAVPALTGLLQHERAQVRQNAAHYLGLIPGTEIVPPLTQALQDPNPGVRDQAIWALGRSASEAAILPLAHALEWDPDHRVRLRAAMEHRFLKQFLVAEKADTVEQRVAQLVPLAAHDLARSRLLEIGAPAVPALIAGLDYPDPSVAAGAAAILAALGDERGLAPLMEKYRASLEKEPVVSFAQALAEYQHPAAWVYWLQLLPAPDPAGQYWGVRAIAASNHADRQQILLKFLETQVEQGEHRQGVELGRTKVNPTAEVCRILGEIGDEQALPLLRRIVADVPKDHNIVRPLAERSCRQIEERLGN